MALANEVARTGVISWARGDVAWVASAREGYRGVERGSRGDGAASEASVA